MKIFRSLLFFALVAMMAFTSCEKDSINTSEVEIEEVVPKVTEQNGLLTYMKDLNNESVELGCISLNLPFDMEMSDESTITINSVEDLEAVFVDATEDYFPVDFVYPLDGTDEDGNSLTFNNADELGEAFVECVPEGGWDGEEYPEDFFPAWEINFDNSCYELAYPLTVMNQDGEEESVANEEELLGVLSDGNYYSFVFPLTLIDEDGAEVTADDGEALFDLLADCYPDGGPTGCDLGGFLGCYELGYPATLIDYDGNSVVVNNDDEFNNFILNGEWAGFGYPLTLIDEEGNELMVNSEEELFEAFVECDDYYGGGGPGGGPWGPGDLDGFFGCYELGYPATVVDFDGNSVVVNNEDEFAELLFSGEWAGFGYPLTLIDEDGNTIVVDSEEGLFEALSECEGFGGGGPWGPGGGPEEPCFDFQFPFTLEDLATGEQYTLNSPEDWMNIPMDAMELDFVFPLTIVYLESGETITVNDHEELGEAIAECW